MRTFVIAEPGSCHDGKLDNLIELAHVAKVAGADAFKVQYWSSADRLAERRGSGEKYREIYARYQMPLAWFEPIAKVCTAHDLELMSTVYLPEDVKAVAPYVSRFKVASFEQADESLRFELACMRKPVVISTGMLHAREWKPREWTYALNQDRLIFLHCVSAYPCPSSAANLGAIRQMKAVWDKVGYSDHTAQVATGALAVAVGAMAVESHIRLGETDPLNPDASTALPPILYDEYVRRIREAEILLGNGEKKPNHAERDMMQYRVRQAEPSDR